MQNFPVGGNSGTTSGKHWVHYKPLILGTLGVGTYAHILLPVGTNGKPLATVSKFPNTIGKLMIGKTLATNGEEITNAMIGNAVLAVYW